MKKILATITGIIALLGFVSSAYAIVGVGWNATSTDPGFIQPNQVNGFTPFVKAPYFEATTTTATSTFHGGVNITYQGGCLAINGGCLSLAGSGVTSISQTYGTAQTGAISFATSSAVTINGLTFGNTLTNSSGSFTLSNTITGTLSVPASQITSGTFGVGNYIFPAQITVLSSTTLQNFTAINATTTSATSTNMATTNLCLSGDCRSAWPSSGGGSYPFPLTGNATSTLTQFNGGLTAYASSTIGNGTQAGGLTINGAATTSSLFGAGLSVCNTNQTLVWSSSLGTFTCSQLQPNGMNGSIHAGQVLIVSGGLATWGAVDLSNSTFAVANTLGIGNGGTGTSSPAKVGDVLVFNGTNYVGTATSSLGITGGSGAAYPFQLTGNATSTLTQFNGGLTAYASSTIGNGLTAGGLTVNGGATTSALFGAGLSTCNTGGTSALTYTLSSGLFGCNIITGGNTALNFETPSGTINGVNATFTVANPPLYLTSNGQVLLQNVDYTLSGLTITMNVAPPTSTILRSWYSGNTSFWSQNGTALFYNGGNVGIGTSSPYTTLSVVGTTLADNFIATSTSKISTFASSVLVSDFIPATTTTIRLSMASSTSQTIRIGTAATTITLADIIPGSVLRAEVCNPTTTAGAITWAATSPYWIRWSGGTVPTQTTTGNACDLWTFSATSGTTTTGFIHGAQIPW